MSRRVLAALWLLTAVPCAANLCDAAPGPCDVVLCSPGGEGLEGSPSASAIVGGPVAGEQNDAASPQAVARAIAENAIRKKWLSSEARALFTSVVLPALEARAVGMLSLPASKLPGSEAVYSSELDAVKSRGILSGDEHSDKVMLHELVHAAQDACRFDQSRKNSERDAYFVEAEFLLRRANALIEQDDGAVRIAAGDISGFEGIAKLVIYKTALVNARSGRGVLNDFSDGAPVEFASLPREDAVEYFRKMAETSYELAASEFTVMSGMSDMVSGQQHDPEQLLRKDGLKGLPHPPGEACKRWASASAQASEF